MTSRITRRVVVCVLTLGAIVLPIGWGNIPAAETNNLAVSSLSVTESNLIISGTGGVSGATYYILASTNLELSPVSSWDRISTNTFAADGTFTNSLPIDPALQQEFFAIATTFQPSDTNAPTAPENLVATAVSSNQIDLSWTSSTDNVAVTEYLLERQDPMNTNFVQIGSTTATNYSDTGLAAYTEYGYRVRATDAAENMGPYSSVANATTFAILPVASFTGSPTNGAAPLTVTFTDDSSGTISNRFWDFGDTSTSNTTATSVLHTYALAGTNTVSLTVTGPLGTTNQTRTSYILVVNPAQLVVNPGSLNFGSVTINQTNSLSFSVINTGDLLLSGTATSGTPFAVTSGESYSIAGGQTQAVTVIFAPGSAGTQTGSVVFISNGGTSTNAVSGVGLTAGSISVSPTNYVFGVLATGTTAQATFTVTNSGGTSVSNGTATVGAPFAILSGATFTVPGLGATNVVVQFAPVTTGSFTDNIVFATANGGNATNAVSGTGAVPPAASFAGSPTNGPWPLTVTFSDSSSGTITNRFWDFGDSGTSNTTSTSVLHTYSVAGTNTVSLTVAGPLGTSNQTQTNYIVAAKPAQLAINPSSLNYGAITIGQTNGLSLSVINTGDLLLSGTATSGVPFVVTSGGSYNVGGGQTQAVTVIFAPGSAGALTGSVIFVSNGGNSTNTVSGIGLTAGSISVSPANHDFGTLATGTIAQTTFIVTNFGGTAVSNGTASVGAPFSIVSGATFSVPGLGATNVVVQFAPVSAGGFNNNVIFSTANGGNATNAVTGTGAIVPVASFTGSPTNGAVPLTVTFTDSSSGTITNRFWNFGDSATSNTAATSVLHTYNAVGSNTVSLTVSGPVGASNQTRTNYIVAVNPAHLTINPGSLNYGSITIGQTNSLSFSVTNTGDLLLSGTATSAFPFAVTSGGNYNVAGGQAQPVTVAFAPTSNATFNGSVIFVSNGGNSTNAISGVGLTAGSISVNPINYDFGTLVTGTTVQASFTILNSGGTAVSNGTTSVGAPFSIVSGATFGVPGLGTTNVTVQFAPLTAGSFTNNVMLATANGGNATSVVTGTGAMVPVAAYSFDEGTGTTVTDASGHGNNGTIGSATWTNSGKYGNALMFNGSSARVTVADSTSLHLTTGMTLEVWVNPIAVDNNWRDVIYKGTNSPNHDNYFLEATSDHGGVPGGGGTFGGVNTVTFGAGDLVPGAWTHLAMTYDSVTLRLYVNGTQVSSLAKTGNILVSVGPLQIGGDGIFGQYFQGRIDEVRVYNAALPLAQIQSDMITPVGTIPTAPINLTATTAGGSQINLGWTATRGNLGSTYLVERLDPGSTNFAQIGTTTSTTYGDSGLTASASYSYRVKVANGPYSNVAQAYAGLAIVPRTAVLTFTRTQQFALSLGNVNVTWSVDGVVGGSAPAGTITSAGLYTPPSSNGTHKVTVLSADLSQSATATVYVTDYPGMFTYHNDNFRSGQNLNEKVLTPTNISTATFGKLFSYPLDGMTFASPLYVANLNIPGKGFHNVVFVATEHDSVYAFDADGLTNGPLWQRSFINPAGGVTTVPAGDTLETGDIPNEIGITSTPVIDLTNNTMYVVVKTKEVVTNTTSYVQRLHALDITTGTNKLGGPVVIQGSVAGTGLGSSGGQLPFTSIRQNQRTALLLANGVVYFGFASHGDHEPFHGWVMGYNATNLQQVLVYCSTPNGDDGGIWMNGDGLATDASTNLYFITGDGMFNANTGGSDYGDCFVKINTAGTVLDYFSPSVQASLDTGNFDLGSGGVLLLPDQAGAHPHEMVSAGKNGAIYLVDRDNMGHFTTNDSQIVQALTNIFTGGTGLTTGNFGSPVYHNGFIYFAAISDRVRAFRLTNGLLSTNSISQSPQSYGYPGGMLAVSANGNTNGILWAVQRNGSAAPGTLHAYDAANLANELFNSDQAGSRDTLDIASKFNIPLVANGKVFVSSVGQLTVYGLLP